MTFGDGRLHRAVATHLAADETTVPSLVAHSGPAIRYGRVGLPATLWAFSGGNERAMRYVQPILMVLCAAAIAAAAQKLFPRGPLNVALAPFIAIGLTVSLAGGFAEPLAIAFGLWAIVAWSRERPIAAATLLAAAMLTRENTVTILIGLLAWELYRRRPRALAVLGTSIVPVAIWHIVVATRFGGFPLLDPWLRETGTIQAPFIGIWNTFQGGDFEAIAVVAGHLVVVAISVGFWRRGPLALLAAFGALSLITAGQNTWQYIGDATRVASVFEVMFVLAMVEMVLRRRGRDVLSGHDYPLASVDTGQVAAL